MYRWWALIKIIGLASAEVSKIKLRHEKCSRKVRQTPRKEDLKKVQKRRRRMRKVAAKASRRVADRMVNRFVRKNPPSVYKIGEQILVRLRHNKHHEPKNIGCFMELYSRSAPKVPQIQSTIHKLPRRENRKQMVFRSGHYKSDTIEWEEAERTSVLPAILLGHFAEGQGDHYVSLVQTPPEIASVIDESNNIYRLEDSPAQDTRDSLPDLSYYGQPKLSSYVERVDNRISCNRTPPLLQSVDSPSNVFLQHSESWWRQCIRHCIFTRPLQKNSRLLAVARRL